MSAVIWHRNNRMMSWLQGHPQLAQHQHPPTFCTHTRRLGLGRSTPSRLGLDNQDNWPKLTKGISILDDICSDIKKKKEGSMAIHYICLPLQPLLSVKWLDIAWWWKTENKVFCFFIFACACTTSAILKCLFLDPWGFFQSYFLPLPVLLRRGVIEWLGRQLVSSQGQPTTHEHG